MFANFNSKTHLCKKKFFPLVSAVLFACKVCKKFANMI
jgi:hypothetical protein